MRPKKGNISSIIFLKSGLTIDFDMLVKGYWDTNPLKLSNYIFKKHIIDTFLPNKTSKVMKTET